MASVVNKETGIRNTVIRHIRHSVCSRFKVLGIINQRRLRETLGLGSYELGLCTPRQIQAVHGCGALVFIEGKVLWINRYTNSTGLLFTVNKSGQILSFINCWIKLDPYINRIRFLVNDLDIAFALSNEFERCELKQQYQAKVYQLFEKEDEFLQIPYKDPWTYKSETCEELHTRSIFELFSPDHPLDIALSCTGSVLGCFNESIKRYSQNGSVEQTIEVGADCITETRNRDICAAKRSDIFLINEQSMVTHRFVGVAHESNLSSIVDIVSDSYGRILVAENGRVHILDQELCYIGVVMSWLRDGVGRVISIDVDVDDNLWVLDEDSMVWVVKYHV